MSVILSSIIALGLSSTAQAKIESLVCGASTSQGTIRVTLDSSSFDPSSGYKDATDARLIYKFSTIQKMACEGIIHDREYDTDCVGLYAGSREPMILKLRTEGSEIVAYWRTSRDYGSKDMRATCQIEP